MTRTAVLLVALLGASGCDAEPTRRFPAPTGPTPVFVPPPPPLSPPPPPPSVVRSITLGEAVNDRTAGEERHFMLTAPSGGTMVTTLTWDPDWNGTLLKLRIKDVEFTPTCCTWSPVVGRSQVARGEQVLIIVSVGGSDWFPDDPFVLTTAME